MGKSYKRERRERILKEIPIHTQLAAIIDFLNGDKNALKEVNENLTTIKTEIENPFQDHIEREIEHITNKYSKQREHLQKSLIIGLIADGPTMEANLTKFRQEWTATNDAESAEILTLFS